MEKFAAAFLAFGGLTAVGGFIDLLMRSSEKKRLKGWLTDWWIRFDDVKWGNFGQQEAAQAIAILDRWAGARLWSIARWRAVTIVSLAAFATACVLFLLLTTLRWFEDDAHLSFVAYHTGTWRSSYLPSWIFVPLFLACPVCFALALSVMRLLAACVRDWAPPGVAGLLSFGALLLVQVAIAIYWTAGLLLVGLVSGALVVMAVIDSGRLWDPTLSIDFAGLLSPGRILAMQLDGILGADSMSRTAPVGIFLIFKALLDAVANGLRIGFALLFLGSFLFEPLVKPLVSRLWEGIIESDKPIFALTFGGLAAAGGAIATLLR